ncbi:OmpA family protein [Candidatus Halobeggiatoa sp. HSG11]|nr:OmpA family protein [Candidatus Halobeggiatoa sp. HSG11]
MEEFFGTVIVKEKTLNYYIPEISLLLLTTIIAFVSVGYLSYLTHNQEKDSISGQLITVNNPVLTDTSDLTFTHTKISSKPEIVSKSLTLPDQNIAKVIISDCSELINTSSPKNLKKINKSSSNQINTELTIAACFELVNSNQINLKVVNPVQPTKTIAKSKNTTCPELTNTLNKSDFELVKSTLSKQDNFNVATCTPYEQTTSLSQIISQALVKEFKDDLLHWSANISYLTIDFKDATFNTGGSAIDKQYRSILAEFCPRYISVLNKYAHDIEAISIEGHSSSEWQSSNSVDDAYLNNMLLSQQRTNAVLAYCLRLPTMKPYKDWLRNILITSGLSSSHLIVDNEVENTQRSRRVEFKIYVHSK